MKTFKEILEEATSIEAVFAYILILLLLLGMIKRFGIHFLLGQH